VVNAAGDDVPQMRNNAGSDERCRDDHQNPAPTGC
jgi:hypothetical protein